VIRNYDLSRRVLASGTWKCHKVTNQQSTVDSKTLVVLFLSKIRFSWSSVWKMTFQEAKSICPIKDLVFLTDACVYIQIHTWHLPNKPRYLSGMALGYGLDDRGFESREGLGIFLLTTASRPVLGPTGSPTQRVSEALPLWVKRPGREADHSPPSSVEVKNAWNYTTTPPIRLHGVVLS
jgi:hypothetical protein